MGRQSQSARLLLRLFTWCTLHGAMPDAILRVCDDPPDRCPFCCRCCAAAQHAPLSRRVDPLCQDASALFLAARRVESRLPSPFTFVRSLMFTVMRNVRAGVMCGAKALRILGYRRTDLEYCVQFHISNTCCDIVRVAWPDGGQQAVDTVPC